MEKKERIQREYPDIKILTLWETDVYFNIDSVVEKILNFIGNEPVSYDLLDVNSFYLKPLDKKIGERFLKLYHYLHSIPLTTKIIHGLYHKDSLIGVAAWGSPTAKNREDKKRLELYRFCLVDGLPKNTASYFLSRCIKNIIKEYREYDQLISYADTGYHVGTIYKATNWKEEGEVKGSYYYLNRDNEKIDRRKVATHCKSLGIKEKEYVDKLGLSRVDQNIKKKYVYYIK